jgi:hypothetical protein
MSNKKTIQINPELFKLSGGQKTRRNRSKPDIDFTPIVSTNNIKNKLLSRIKEHKKKQFESTSTKDDVSKNTSDNDEFYGAINYLSELSKKQKKTSQEALYKQQLQNKTMKNNERQPDPYVSIDLPPELDDPVFKEYSNSKPMNLIHDDVPYGCLKNGIKPSYRSWMQTRKNYDNPVITALSNARPPTPPKKNGSSFTSTQVTNTQVNTQVNPIQSINHLANRELTQFKSREERLESIKQKLKHLEHDNFIQESFGLDDLDEFDEKDTTKESIDELLKTRNQQIEKSIPKNMVKKTIRRKFTLGKSDKLRKVAVLIKNRQTRKNVINTQKELKKTSITDVRKYLRQHGMIKAGSTCPTDILRKTFESSLMAGEITNTNKDILLHNFLNESNT